MKTMKFFGIALLAAYAACTAGGAVCASFDAATIASNGVKVADWMLAHPKRANHRDWSYGAFYAGLAEFARATGERRYIDAIREEGRTYGWKFEKRDADVRGEKKKLFWLFSISKRTGAKWRCAPHYRDYMLLGDSARTGVSCTFVCREGGVRVPARRRGPNGRRGRVAIGETTRHP